MNKVSKVREEYNKLFPNSSIIVRAPGRINLIGEHTDYNNGFVLPAAVSKAIYLAIGKSNDTDSCTLVALDLDETYPFKLSDLKALPKDSWQNYILGVVSEIQKSGRETSGFNLVFSGDIPQGSGMSSSAALACGTCFAINEIFELGIPKLDMVKMSQKAEHNYAGVNCGIMDQFASMMGQKNKVLLLDCENLEYSHFPIKLEQYTLLLCDSNVSHNLASSAYNVRRLECEEGVNALQKLYPGVNSLRYATLEQLSNIKDQLNKVTYLRCKYVIEENKRVQVFAKALLDGDFNEVGNLMAMAHCAMRYEYEITCPEIDFMADYANKHNDVLGSRMMGGGFGGCTLNLIKNGREESFIEGLNAVYAQKFSKSITPIAITIVDGVELINGQ